MPAPAAAPKLRADPILLHLEAKRAEAAAVLAAIDADLAEYTVARTATPALVRLRDAVRMWRCTYEAGLRRCQRSSIAVKNENGDWLIPRSLVDRWSS